ncbi:MAG TPA: bifunctional precorrin-2 dehydrogenase/sirohydrochlorin ferrochelatase [Thermoleophilia bacterium]|nr:bifunctional precorrin-2 dehydrogenase/sirohydrochlorin ferrochelatase [Thermoleophilia bacterium]
MDGSDDGRGDGTQVKRYYPVVLDLRSRACLIIGGGAVALRKARGLIAAGADVTVVAPECLPMPDEVTIALRPFVDADLDGVALAMAATDDRELNARVARLARERGVWVNVADDPEAGDAILPAVARRGDLQIAVSTGGASPALAQRLRERLEDEFGPEYAELVALLGALRAAWEPRAIAAGVPPAARRAAWHAVLDLPLAGMLADGCRTEAEALAQAILERVLADAGQ